MLCKDDKCTGCGACESVCPIGAISLLADELGFLKPVIDEDKCIHCGKCERTCPELSEIKLERFYTPKAYAAWSLNSDYRKKGSSGGLFACLADNIIKNNGKVYSAVYNQDFSVSFMGIKNIDEIKKLQGSKYCQSYTNFSFKAVKKDLEENLQVLFCGLPCQIAGLYSYLGKDYDNLNTIDIVCHGVPSNEVFKKYIAAEECRYNEKIIGINQRESAKKWSPMLNFVTKIITSENEYLIKGQGDSFMILYNSFVAFNECCYKCSYASLPRKSDITLGDFFGLGIIEKFKNKDTKNGVSQVLINSNKGETLFDRLSSDIFIEERQLRECTTFNKNIIKPTSLPDFRQKFIEDYKVLSYEELDLKYFSGTNKISRKVKSIIRFLLGDKIILRIIFLFGLINSK